MRKKFRDLLHAYRVESFKITHNNDQSEESATEILKFTEDALNNAYHYTFHRPDPDAERVETFNMIKRFTLEAILPPVIEKVMRRVMILERQNEAMVQLIDNLLEALSEEQKRERDVG